jgi:hypothetical protein
MGEISYCLGLRVEKDEAGNYSIHQQDYIERLMEKHSLHPSTKALTPLSTAAKLDDIKSPLVDSTHYRSIIGALIYLAVGTRPDIAQAVSKLAKYSNAPRTPHLKAAERLVKYLYNTRRAMISYNPETPSPLLEVVADASHACCRETGKSRTGFVVCYVGAPVAWKSQRQTVVAKSTRDAEYIAMSESMDDLQFVVEFIEELQGVELQKPIPVHCDCAPAIDTVQKDGFNKKSKTIRLSYHSIRDIYKQGLISTVKIPSKNNPADLLTKALGKEDVLRHLPFFFGEEARLRRDRKDH